ncbi:uncharacterized protein BDZ99DRAFT_528339 [Mytilinidion resinicola]|uniref:Uncharacterized protein n=1 Tax=Mytilinidion resinicola TaxID=574789 RepID=A0A6A6Y0S1_9PEZI|nr:uncharacterized protein BDZ99DRAFT_528339 [Mytilinidion resinicola]KAF2801614.1 hypothetical protein BDZ99DRAFT_528339 [Mytilinidion resinicola]
MTADAPKAPKSEKQKANKKVGAGVAKKKHRQPCTIFFETQRGRCESSQLESSWREDRSNEATTNLVPFQDDTVSWLSPYIEADFRLPTTYQPYRGVQFDQLYICHFLSAFAFNGSQKEGFHVWSKELLPMRHKNSTLIYATRAASMAFYGRICQDENTVIEACRWYSASLQSQRESLELARVGRDERDTSVAAICAAILLSTFESMVSTTPLGWLQHYEGAVKVIEILGPEACQSGLLHSLFRSVRHGSVAISMTLEEPSIFSTDVWNTVPFKLQPPSAFDELVGIMLQIPSCLPLRNEMQKFQGVDAVASELYRTYLASKSQHILLCLHQYWEQYQQYIDPNYERRMNRSSPLFGADYSPLDEDVIFQDSCSATYTAQYDSANIAALTYLTAASVVPAKYERKIAQHGDSVLASIAYHELLGSFSGGSFSMILPTKIVCMMSPFESQRSTAQEALRKWGAGRGVSDICTVAAPNVLRPSTEVSIPMEIMF